MRIVISGVNLLEGGTLAVFRSCVAAFAVSGKYEVTCLVHDKSLFADSGFSSVRFIEFPDVKRSWWRRLWFEYHQCMDLSRELKPDIWFSMHDMSPIVEVPYQFVYCHNAAPFHSPDWKDLVFDPRFFLFSLFYGYLFRINIKANTQVFVQQEWIARSFRQRYGIDNICVATPLGEPHSNDSQESRIIPQRAQRKALLFYPSLPRTFKNIELVLEAIARLQLGNQALAQRLTLVLTVRGDENAYARWLLRKYRHLPNVRWTGRLDRAAVNELYAQCDALIFPSRLESWGLPISEAKCWHKPIMVADMRYAHETVGCYDQVCFFSADDPADLCEHLERFLSGNAAFGAAEWRPSRDFKRVNSWAELADLLTAICR